MVFISLPLTITLELPRGEVVANSMSSFWRVAVRKAALSGAVLSLLPELTYPSWYTRLPLVRLVTQVPRVYLIPFPELRYQPSSAMHDTQSAAPPPITGSTHVCLYVVLLVNGFHYWLKGIKNTTFYVKPSFIYKINDSVMKTLVLCIK